MSLLAPISYLVSYLFILFLIVLFSVGVLLIIKKFFSKVFHSIKEVKNSPQFIVPPEVGKVGLAPGRIFWLWGTGLAGIYFGLPLTNHLIFISILFGFLTLCLGHSVGLHRGIIHKTYKTSKIFRNILAYLFIFTGLGGPITWLKLHYYRDYWQNRKDCPPYFGYDHSLSKDFFWNLHTHFEPNKSDFDRYKIPAEDLNDPWLLFLEKTWVLHNLLLAVIVWAIWGEQVMGVCVFARVAASIMGHWYIGFRAHTHGYQRFTIDGADVSGTNLLFLGLISFGEGFHNNHHAHPKSARMGMKWYEIDMGWWMVKIFENLGLVWDVQAWDRAPLTRKLEARLVL